MDITFVYPVRFERAPEGGWVITCRDLPEVISQAEDNEDRIDVAEGALQAAFESRIVLNEPFPQPTAKRADEELVTVPIETATKAALHMVVGEEKPSKSELARRLDLDEKEVRRLMDPQHPSKAPRIAKAVAGFGYRIQVSVVKAHPAVAAVKARRTGVEPVLSVKDKSGKEHMLVGYRKDRHPDPKPSSAHLRAAKVKSRGAGSIKSTKRRG